MTCNQGGNKYSTVLDTRHAVLLVDMSNFSRKPRQVELITLTPDPKC